MKRRVFIYVRVSTLEQAESGYSIDEQVERLIKFCEAHGWIVVKVYRDPGFSGSSLDRPGMQAMISNIESVDAVIVYKLDRLSRSQKDTLYLLEDIFLPAGVAFVSMSESFDTSTSFGKAMIGILAVFAQLEREQIRERMAMGKLGRAKSGKPTAWGFVPFGYHYKGGELITDPLDASVVRSMFDRYLAGSSVHQLVQDLNAEGHIGKEKPWTFRAVRIVLENAVYAGFNNFKGQQYKGNHEPLVSLADYGQVQSELDRRRQLADNPRPFQSKYLVSGLLRCGYCGSPMTILIGNKRADGTRPYRYRCYSQVPATKRRTSRRASEPCCAPPYPKEELERAVLEQVEGLRLDPSALRAKGKDEDEGLIESIKARLNEIKVLLERLVDLYTYGKLPLDVIDAKHKEFEAERAALEAKLGKLRAATSDVSVDAASAYLGSVTTDVRKLADEDQRRVVHYLVEHITLWDGKMIIKWRFA